MPPAQQPTRWDRRDAGALALIALVAAGLHWQFVLLGRIPLNTDWLTHNFEPWRSALNLPAPHNPELDDPAVLHYPLWLTARRIMRAGHWPLWNPRILCGTPLLADTMCNPFDPVNLATLPLPDDVAWGLMILMQFVIAGWGAYVFMRGQGLCRVAGIAAAVCFMLNGFFIVWMELKFVVACFCWLFWMLWAIDRAAATLKLRWSALAGLFYAFAVFGGNLHHLLNFTLLAGLYILFRLGCVWRDHGRQAARTATGTIVLGIFFGVCLSAPQWATTYELMQLCSRSAGKYSVGNYLHWGELFAFVAPKFFGHPVDGNFVGGAFFGRSYLTMNSPYVGAFALPFILMGAFCVRRRDARFFAVVGAGVVAFMLLLGWGSLHRALAAFLPIDTLDHHRLLSLPAVCAAVLVGFGMDHLLSRPRGAPRPREIGSALAPLAIVLVAVLVSMFVKATGAGLSMQHGAARALRVPGLDLSKLVLYLGSIADGWPTFVFAPQVAASLAALLAGGVVALWALFKPMPRVLAPAMLICLAVELLYFGWAYNPYVPRARVYPSTPVLDFLQANARGARIIGVEGTWANRWKGDVIPPASGLCYGLSDVRGKEGMFPMRTRQFFEMLRRRADVRFLALVHFSHADSRAFDLLGAKYIVSAMPLGATVLQSRATRPLSHTTPGYLREVFRRGLHVYENRRSFPRAFASSKSVVFRRDSDLLTYMRRRDFDPRAAILLDRVPEIVVKEAHDAAPATIEIVQDTPNRVVLSVDAAADCYLVLADTNFPGWRATIDGRRVILQNAYYLLRCVSVPKGKHEVVFDYWPVSFQVGLALAAAALIAAGIGGVVALARARRPDKAP